MKAIKSTQILLVSFIVVAFFGMTNGGLPYGDPEELFVHVNILNPSNDDVDEAHMRLFIYETDDYMVSRNFDVDDNSNNAELIMFDQQDVKKHDYYPVRVVLTNEDVRVVKHVWTWI